MVVGPVVTGDEAEIPAETVRRFTSSPPRCMKRFGSEADIVGPLLFLAGELSSWITGQMLVVDGGGNMPGSASGPLPTRPDLRPPGKLVCQIPIGRLLTVL